MGPDSRVEIPSVVGGRSQVRGGSTNKLDSFSFELSTHKRLKKKKKTPTKNTYTQGPPNTATLKKKKKTKTKKKNPRGKFYLRPMNVRYGQGDLVASL